MKNKNTKTWWIIGIILLTLILILGLGVYFGYFKIKKNTDNKPITPITKTDYFPGNNIQNVGNKTGFIVNNWGMISNDKFNNFGNYILDINKAIADVKKDKFYLSNNSISDHSLVGMDIVYNNDKARVGHLNALNFSLLDDKSNLVFKDFHNPNVTYTTQFLHSYFVAKTISFFSMDIIGLTEINKDTPIKNAENFLNMLNLISNTNNQYKFIMSDNLQGKTATAGQVEKVIIFYNSKKFKLMNNDLAQLTYPNELYTLNKQTSQWTVSQEQNPTQPIDISLYYDFVRPPFSGVFESIDKSLRISPIFSHNDSPGAAKGEITLSGMGAKEFFEANQIQNVLTYYKNKFPNFHPIYLGDTNIKYNKEATAFSTINKQEYSFAFEDKKEYSTSLTTSSNAKTQLNSLFALNKTILNQQDIKNKKAEYLQIFSKLYANPYDKIIYDNNLNVLKFNETDEVITYSKSDLSNQFVDLIYESYFIVQKPMFLNNNNNNKYTKRLRNIM